MIFTVFSIDLIFNEVYERTNLDVTHFINHTKYKITCSNNQGEKLINVIDVIAQKSSQFTENSYNSGN